uniref:hypothetical protein n=1 Tax=Sphingomonas sp. LHG3443-2 TaxID=2804639 RepID=UPI003CEAAE02
NNWAALGHAERLGLRPNTSLDIHFHRAGLSDPLRNAGASLKAFLKSARQWIERKGGQTVIIWVLENRAGFRGEGIHAHVLMHVPPELLNRWHQLRRTWARKAGMEPNTAGGTNFTALPTLANAKGKLRYMSKDLDPQHWPVFAACPRYHVDGCPPSLDDRDKPSNAPIYGLKTGVSRNVGPKARSSYQQAQAEKA